MLLKVIRIGNSLGVTIPKREMKRLGLKIGDELIVTISKPKVKPNND